MGKTYADRKSKAKTTGERSHNSNKSLKREISKRERSAVKQNLKDYNK